MSQRRPSQASILREIRALRAQPSQEALARTLDALDTWSILEVACARRPSLRSWGPKAVQGVLPRPWVGSVLWQRGEGYAGYRTLLIAGIWACDDEGGQRLIIGQKTLPYAAPFYEAEAYHKLMRTGFDVYYRDDGAPPPSTSRVLDIAYAEAQRLELREKLKAAFFAL
jgi:hypothetical protein